MSSMQPLERRPRILGVTFDTYFIFYPHIDSIITWASSRTNILKVLAGTNWGPQKHSILITYKFLIGSLFIYVAPIRFTTYFILLGFLLFYEGFFIARTFQSSNPSQSSSYPWYDHLSLLCSQFFASNLAILHKM